MDAGSIPTPASNASQYLPPHKLRNVTPADLPNGLHLFIERIDAARLAFRNIHFLTLRKHHDRVTLALGVALNHADWHLPVNLFTFAEGYVEALATGETTVLLDRSEYGVDITYSVVAPVAADLYEMFSQAADRCLRVYRERIAVCYQHPSARAETKQQHDPADTSGTKWWLRFVLVPLLAAFAGVVATILLKK